MAADTAKRLMPAVLLTGLLILALFFYAGKTGFSPGNYLENQKAKAVSVFKVVDFAGDVRLLAGDWAVSATPEAVTGTNLKTSESWTVNVPDYARVHWVEDGFACRDSGNLKVFGADGNPVFTLKASRDLKGLFGRIDSGLLFQYDTPGGQMMAGFSRKGQFLWELPVPGEELLAASVSPDDGFTVNLAEVSGGNFKSKLLSIGKNGELKWAFDLGEDVAAVLGRCEKGTVVADPGRILFLDNEGGVLKDYTLNERLIKADFNPLGFLAVVYKTRSGSEAAADYGLKLYKPDGETVYNYKIKTKPGAVRITGDAMETVVAVDNVLYGISNTGKVLFRHTSNTPIQDVFTGDNLFPLLIKTGDKYVVITGALP